MTEADRAVLNKAATDVATISEVVKRLERRLYGNGQPGDVAIINSRIVVVETEQRRVRAEVAKVRNRAWGILAGASAVASLLGAGVYSQFARILSIFGMHP